MDLYKIIRELVQERDKIDRIIQSLEDAVLLRDHSTKPARKRRGRKSMDEAARAEVSERMKRYWSRRRAEKEASQDPS